MTLALAMVADAGLILAADTRVSYLDGSVGEMQKVVGFPAKNGRFLIAQSADDANAGNTVMSAVRSRLENYEIKSRIDLEWHISQAMLSWYIPNQPDRPDIQLFVAACIENIPERILYLCQPPNVISPVTEDYKAIGNGWSVSDPIFQWFKDRAPWPIHPCLCQISYMMYRAKKLLPGYVGGPTDVGILTDWQTEPYWINRMDMFVAESHGIVFDRHLSNFASMAMGGKTQGTPEMMLFAEGFYSCELLYSRESFRCQFPDQTFYRFFT